MELFRHYLVTFKDMRACNLKLQARVSVGAVNWGECFLWEAFLHLFLKKAVTNVC